MKEYLNKLRKWFDIKVSLNFDEKSKKNIFKQAEIYYINFGTNIGSEFNGLRPALIFEESKYSYFRKNVIVLPITSYKKYNKFDIKIKNDEKNGLKSDSIVKLFHIRDICKSRVKTKIGILDSENFEKVKSQFQKIYNKKPKN